MHILQVLIIAILLKLVALIKQHNIYLHTVSCTLYIFTLWYTHGTCLTVGKWQ